MRWLLMFLPMILLASCRYDETTKETGHKGRARINPYLAAERLLEEFDYEVESKSGWPELDDEASMAVLPASALSARAYVDDLDAWASYGGHAVVLLNHGEAFINDWSSGRSRVVEEEGDQTEAFAEWMDGIGVELDYSPGKDDDPLDVDKVEFLGESFEVFMESKVCPVDEKGEPVMIRSFEYGDGRVTIVADARPFRNRWIGDNDHAGLLLAIGDASPYAGTTSFIRNVSLSFFGLLWARAWPALVALGLLVVFWLWKNLPRSGPLDSHESVGETRAYDHHLEALGDFHWRLDQAQGLLKPLREMILERAQRLALTSGHRESDVFEIIAERAGIPRERAVRAMTFERSKDAGTFTRVVADLQTIHLSIP